MKAELVKQESEIIEIPCIINGEEVFTGDIVEQVMPHDHSHVIARVHMAGEKEVKSAINAALDAHKMWSTMPWESRCAIFLKASELLAGPRRAEINASTMLNQSKTCHQAEIDSACELIDFWRFNSDYCRQIYEDLQPPVSPSSMWNSSEVRISRRIRFQRYTIQFQQYRSEPTFECSNNGQYWSLEAIKELLCIEL